jgi:ribosome biogenesis GTPase / thiamine phosphate phosphatase
MPETKTADRPLTFETLGWNSFREEHFSECRQQGLDPGRIAIEDKQHYVVLTRDGRLSARIAGKLLHKAGSPAELPKVGDWVALAVYPQENKAVIHHVLPRRTKLSRKVPGRGLEEHVLVTNVDTAVVVQALDSTFNPRLLERHLLMVLEGGVAPVIALNKTDVCDRQPERVSQAKAVAGGAPIIAVSARTGQAIDDLMRLIRPGETVVFIGGSGVGKSTLINSLYGEEIQATAEVRESDSKGRHTTSWRELIVLPNGALVIDTPGMRELQIWLSGEGIHEAFPDIEELALQCRFGNCSHTVEQGCAVLQALAQGILPRARYDGCLKLLHEIEFLERAQRWGTRVERTRFGRKGAAAGKKRR